MNVQKTFRWSLPLARSMASAAKPQSAGAYEADLENAKSMSEMPKIKFSTFFIRDIKRRMKNEPIKNHLLFSEFHETTNSDVFRIWVPGRGDMIFLRDPEDVKTLVAGDGKNVVEPGFDFFVEYRQKLRPDLFPDSPGLIGTQGEDWYEVRNKVQQDMMRPKSALYYIDDVSKVSKDFLELIELNLTKDRRIDDVTPFLHRWALEAVGAIFLDSRIGCLKKDLPKEAEEMIKHTTIVLGDVMQELMGMPLHRLYRTKALDTFDKSSEAMFNLTSKFIAEAKARMADKKASSKEEMSVLEKLMERCGENSTIPQVMAMDALFAGIDTTGNTSSFLYYLLASNPDKQELLHKEVMEKVGDKQITPAILNDLKYVKAVVNETTRMRPAVGGLSRLTQKDLVLGGYKVPKGSIVNYMTVMTMRSEQQFPKADRFIPERWIRGSVMENKAHPYAYIPFGHGARMCIGRRFAQLELQMLAIETVRKYKISCDEENIDIVTPFVNRPEKPISIKFQSR